MYIIITRVVLKLVNEFYDLSVIHDTTKLTYEKHIDNITHKTNKMLSFVMRSCSQFFCIKTIKILYCSYVRSILEYCSQVWNPQYDVHVKRLESVQKNMTRCLQLRCGNYDDSYEVRCIREHLLPLNVRRKIADVTFLVKIAQSKIDSPYLLDKLYVRVPTRSVTVPITQLSLPDQISTRYAHGYIHRYSNIGTPCVGTIVSY